MLQIFNQSFLTIIYIQLGAGYPKITYERALGAVKFNLDKCSVSETLIAGQSQASTRSC